MKNELEKELRGRARDFIPERFWCVADDEEPMFSAKSSRYWIEEGVLYGALAYTNIVWHESKKEQPAKGSIVVVWSPERKKGFVSAVNYDLIYGCQWAYLEELLPQHD